MPSFNGSKARCRNPPTRPGPPPDTGRVFRFKFSPKITGRPPRRRTKGSGTNRPGTPLSLAPIWACIPSTLWSSFAWRSCGVVFAPVRTHPQPRPPLFLSNHDPDPVPGASAPSKRSGSSSSRLCGNLNKPTHERSALPSRSGHQTKHAPNTKSLYRQKPSPPLHDSTHALFHMQVIFNERLRQRSVQHAENSAGRTTESQKTSG